MMNMSFSYRQMSENQIKDIFQNNKLILVNNGMNQFSHIFYLLFHVQWQTAHWKNSWDEVSPNVQQILVVDLYFFPKPGPLPCCMTRCIGTLPAKDSHSTFKSW